MTHPAPAPDVAPKATLRRLGWPQVLAQLAGRTRTPMGRAAAETLAPLPDRDAVQAHLARLGEVQALHREGETFPVGDVVDAAAHLTHAEKEGLLEGPALREVATVLSAASDCAQFLDRFAALAPRLKDDHPDLGGLDGLGRRILRAIDPSGEVADEASPELAEARARVRKLHERMRRTAEEMVHSPEWGEKLQDTFFSVRGDRYVLPVKAAFRYQVGGIVHNVSNTGQTVFLEPPALVEGGNELAMAVAAEQEEVRRILQELTRTVRGQAHKIRADLAVLGRLDLLEAMARLASALDAAVPDIPEAPRRFDLRGLRHPLLVLQGKKVVPNDVRLEDEASCLVVSGPNAGGKTVTISAVALSAVLLRHGLPIPADPGSVLPLYDTIRAVSGDEQDLERDLSTFTAHLGELNKLLAAARPGALLLVDEIAADTDPREGAALAVAVLETLLEAGAEVLVTTHLEALKALAATDPRFLGAAVGFDYDRMAPTYRLRLKASAGSSALEVAARVGLPAAVVERARTQLSGDVGGLAKAMAALEAAQARADDEALALRKQQRALDQAKAELAQAKEALESERRALRQEGRRALLADLEARRKEVKETIARLQAQPTQRKAGDVDQSLEAEARRLRTEIAAEEEALHGPADTPAPAAGELEVGGYVRAPSFGDREGQVLEVGEADALVAFGGLKMRMARKDLVPLRRAATRAVKARMATSQDERLAKARHLKGESDAPPSERVDLRGLRVDEAIQELERRLDRLFAEGATRAVVIHGYGTGALMRAVRDFLDAAPYVSDHRPGARQEGGEGVTVVELG